MSKKKKSPEGFEQVKERLFLAVFSLKQETGIPIYRWEELLDMTSNGWDTLSMEEKKLLLRTIRSPDSPMGYNLETLVADYRKFNTNTGRYFSSDTIKHTIRVIDEYAL